MTQGPVRLDVSVSYALPRTGIPSAVSFRKWVAAALAGRIRDRLFEALPHAPLRRMQALLDARADASLS